LISFGSIEKGHSGGVNALLSDGSVKFISSDVWTAFKRSLQLGAYGEQWESLPGIPAKSIPPAGDVPALFSIPGLRDLTRYFVLPGPTLDKLLAALDEAEALAKTGTGTLTLTAGNIYTGTTTVASGTLESAISPMGAEAMLAVSRFVFPF
jgi:prepilin-type processing-associated H-X9-DG protein